MTDERNAPFGERLRIVREALGLTRAKLAVLANVSDATIRSIEAGREGAGKISALKVLAAIAKHDPKRARWIAEAADAPSHAALEPGAAARIAPSPIGARILLARRGARKELSIRLDWEAVAQLIKYLAEQERKKPDSFGLAVALSVAVPDSLGRD